MSTWVVVEWLCEVLARGCGGVMENRCGGGSGFMDPAMDGGVATNLVVRHCAHWGATLVWQKLTICQQLFFVFLFGIRE